MNWTRPSCIETIGCQEGRELPEPAPPIGEGELLRMPFILQGGTLWHVLVNRKSGTARTETGRKGFLSQRRQGRKGKGLLVGVAQAQEGLFPEGATDQLHPNGEAGGGEATRKREGWMAGNVEGSGEASKDRSDISRFASE